MADKLYDLKQIEMDNRAFELLRAEEECRRAINSAVRDYNNALVNNIYSIFIIQNITADACHWIKFKIQYL